MSAEQNATKVKETEVLIIGGVAAGTKACAKAKRQKPELDITLVTEDTHISYAGCGLAYYIGNLIDDASKLMVRTPETFEEDTGVSVLTRNRVTALDLEARLATVLDLKHKETYQIHYDKLVIATGASPIMPPLPGINLDGVSPLRTLMDAMKVRQALDEGKIKKAVVIGGGYIGVEVAENLVHRGVETVLVELMPHVLPNFDDDVAMMAQREMEDQGVKVFCNTKAEAILGNDKGHSTGVKTTAGEFEADLVIVAVGVRPNVQLAKEAGLELGPTGAIKVNDRMETSSPGVFAAGDCAESTHILTGKSFWAPLGSVANKQGRTVGINLAGGDDRQPGVLGSMIVKVFDFNCGRTGLSVEQAAEIGLEAVSVTVPTHDIAHYYPGAHDIIIRLTAERATGRLLGAYVIGQGVVDKTLDTIITAITFGATTEQLAKLDLAYAPPYSMSISSPLVAANVMQRKLEGGIDGITAHELERKLQAQDDFVLVDVRDELSYMVRSIPGSVCIPLEEFEERLDEIPADKDIVVSCNIGYRSTKACVLLRSKHIGTSVKSLDGGINAWPYETE
jgi:NADPH-dependent 2,4-dienoyl-CoA reductase/sulfur reductase-like enzyme/rhodanese-related sulfurtransferase